MPSDDSPSLAVVRAVASREGVAPEELPEPLYDSIESDALDDLLETGPGRVRFEYLGYEVTVRGTGDVELEPLADG